MNRWKPWQYVGQQSNRGRRWLVAGLGAALILPASSLAAASPVGADSGRAAVQTIPAVHGTTFTGEPVDLPKMLSGKVAVLVIGFSRESREPVADWGRRLAAAYKGSGDVVYYEMPMLAEVPRMLRGVVLRSMRKDVPERAQPRFVPLTEDEARWKDAVGYDKPSEAYVLVVDGAGRVCGREHGAATDALFAGVRAQVATAGGARP